MRTILFTGNAFPGISTVAAATALLAAREGRRTLLLGTGPSANLAGQLGSALGDEPRSIAANLDALHIDVGHEIARSYERVRGVLPPGSPQLSPDELPLIAGLDLFLGLYRLRALAPQYELAVLDGGAYETLLRSLSLPDSVRWGLRLLLGLDRGPGQDARSTLRALLPPALVPPGQLDSVQNARVELEQLRDQLTPGQGASLRWVQRPEPTALDEARLAVPALQLHGLLVDALVSAHSLPDDSVDARIEAAARREQEVDATTAQIWQPRPLLRLPWLPGPIDLDGLAEAGQALYAGHAPDAWLLDVQPIDDHWEGQPALVVRLPGMPREALGLTLSGDELIVRVGPYRRHILLPEGLRGITAIKASRDGERLIIRART